MQPSYLGIIVASALQFIFGAIWYMPIFGKLWGKIHGFDKLSKAEQEKMMKAMGPFYLLQIVTTLITSAVLALFIANLPQDWNAYGMAAFFWLGFIVPTQISAVIFGGIERRWIWKKIGIMTGGSFVCMMIAAAVLKAL